jgi:hypothetical protein
MAQAAAVGLVTTAYAKHHTADVVLFKQVGPHLFEYRAKRPVVGYAGIPWLVTRRTNIDLIESCELGKSEGCTLRPY